jgi:hypothetical protein
MMRAGFLTVLTGFIVFGFFVLQWIQIVPQRGPEDEGKRDQRTSSLRVLIRTTVVRTRVRLAYDG